MTTEQINDIIAKIESQIAELQHKRDELRKKLIEQSVYKEGITRDTPISELMPDVLNTVRALNVLHSYDIYTVGDIVDRHVRYRDLLNLRNAGRKSLDLLAQVLKEKIDYDL